MPKNKKTTSKKAVIYVTRDIERALGKDPCAEYCIITNKSTYALEIQKKFPEFVFLVESADMSRILDTHEILILPDVATLISEKKSDVLVFKNTKQIEEICTKNGWHLLNPSAELSEKIENKISQVSWLGDAKKYLPPHTVGTVSNIRSETQSAGAGFLKTGPSVLQWAHSHTGEGTILIPSLETPAGKKGFALIQEKFPNREARVTTFIKGPMFTANICINPRNSDISSIGNMSYQITGILPFTENPFSTIGNDWSVPHTILTEKNQIQFREIAEAVATQMHTSGWKGLFGIDCIYDEERDMLYLIEVNARQPASTTFESTLQSHVRRHGVPGLTMFEAHLDALQSGERKKDKQKTIPEKNIEINDGAQILQRVTLLTEKWDTKKVQDMTSALEEKKYSVISYENKKINSDLLRIQSFRGIMETHTKFNTRGKEILEIISGSSDSQKK
jgi:hypothetical protein